MPRISEPALSMLNEQLLDICQLKTQQPDTSAIQLRKLRKARLARFTLKWTK